MERRATPRLTAYAGIAGVTLLAAVAVDRPELALLGLPFAVAVLVGLGLSREVEIGISFALTDSVAIEGDDVDLEVTVRSPTGVAWLEVHLDLPPAVGAPGGPGLVLSLGPGDRVTRSVTLHCARWGVHRPARAHLVAYDRMRLFVQRGRVASSAPLVVHPPAERLRELVRPARLQATAGSHISRLRGDGIEFAETRPFAPGDRLRSVNWRATARRDELWVNDRHPDRNADLVLLLDTFTEAGIGLDTTLDLAVEATIALATRHLGAHDRLGIVALGGVLRWVVPGLGTKQLQRIVEAVLVAEVVRSEADKTVDIIPVRGLPPRATIVALSPLIDPRSIGIIGELAARGFDVAVVECSPAPFTVPGKRPTEAVAHRLWLLERDAVRARLRSAGVALTTWERGTPLAAAMDELTTWRRRHRVVVR